jgi:Replication-relaxation
MTNSSERILAILKSVATYYTLTRAQLQDLAGFSGKKNDDRACRKLLLRLLQDGLLSKTYMEVVNPGMGAPAPVYYPSRKGLDYLAGALGEERWLCACWYKPTWQYLYHWTQVAQFHIVLDRAIASQQDVQVERWLGEWDVANPDEHDPSQRFKLFTEIRKSPRLVCNPDAAFLLAYRGYRKVYFLELSRGTSGIQQIAASKTPGFAAMAQDELHRRIFPEANVASFSVLAIEPSANRRDLLLRAIRAKQGASLWKLAAWTDLRADTLLFEPIFYDCEGKAFPLVKRQ